MFDAANRSYTAWHTPPQPRLREVVTDHLNGNPRQTPKNNPVIAAQRMSSIAEVFHPINTEQYHLRSDLPMSVFPDNNRLQYNPHIAPGHKKGLYGINDPNPNSSYHQVLIANGSLTVPQPIPWQDKAMNELWNSQAERQLRTQEEERKKAESIQQKYDAMLSQAILQSDNPDAAKPTNFVGDYEKSCVLCAHDYVAGEHLCRISCKHTFHVDCFTDLLCTSHLLKCPLCQATPISRIASWMFKPDPSTGSNKVNNNNLMKTNCNKKSASKPKTYSDKQSKWRAEDASLTEGTNPQNNASSSQYQNMPGMSYSQAGAGDPFAQPNASGVRQNHFDLPELEGSDDEDGQAYNQHYPYNGSLDEDITTDDEVTFPSPGPSHTWFGPGVNPNNVNRTLVCEGVDKNDNASWIGRPLFENLTENTSEEEAVLSFLSETALKDGTIGLLIDPGSKGNLAGSKWLESAADALGKAGKAPIEMRKRAHIKCRELVMGFNPAHMMPLYKLSLRKKMARLLLANLNVLL
jgi:hypothetical protein